MQGAQKTVEDQSFDFSKWPLVVVRFPELLTVEFADLFIDALTEHGYQRGRFVLVVDLSRLSARSAKSTIRAHIAKRSNAVEAEYPRSLVAEAVIAPTITVRRVLQIYLWLKEPDSYQTKIFETCDGAIGWLTPIMKEHYLD